MSQAASPRSRIQDSRRGGSPALAAHLLTSVIGAVTLISYLFIYTPLKRITWLNTIVGAVPGGLPPLMGWTAAYGELAIEGWALFAILAFWQIPHFMAIAWIYRRDYEQGGYRMLPSMDPDGIATGRQAAIGVLTLIPISLLPTVAHLAGPVYAVGAIVLGIGFLVTALLFLRERTNKTARVLLRASLIYLPLLLVLLFLDSPA